MSNNKIKLQIGSSLVAIILVTSAGVSFAATDPVTPPANSTTEQRIAQRKIERGTALDDKTSKRLISVCVNAQSKLRTIQSAAVSSQRNQSNTYNTIDARIWVVTGQLKLANQDTFALEKQRLALAEKTTAWQTASTDYQQSLDDSLVIDCKADPTGFQALIDTTRILYDRLRVQSEEIKSYVANDVKATLSSHVTDLQPKSADAETN